MEQTFKHTVSSRRTDRYSDVKRNLWLNSNCLHSIAGVFSENANDSTSILGNKKVHRLENDVLN